MARAGSVAGRDQRHRAMTAFLAAQGWRGAAPAMLTADASFRRYYRLADNGRRAVLMDAPPPQEDIRPYVAVAALLRGLGFSAPEIYAEDSDNGFLLIEDFGDDTYTKLLARGADEAALYSLAIDTLIEWPERLGHLLPARRLEITLLPGAAPEARRAAVDAGPDWAARLAALAAEA